MTTEAEALANILTWSVDCPSWQRDALRRFATQGAIDAPEIDELIAISKGDVAAVPLEASHLRDPNRDQGEVYLRQVHGVRHVNALAPDQRLSLHRVGLTIIYGDNGSGKSGYARILKKVCRARTAARGEEIIPDIYEAQPGTPSATIEYAIGGQNRTCAWELGQPADAALSAVSVFDSHTASIHVDETNDVAYTPFPLKLLSNLAQTCKSVKDKLADEITQLRAQTSENIKTPTCSPTSKVGELLARLAATTAPETVEALATLTQSERDRLAQLTADLADPVRLARQLATIKTKIEGHISRLENLFSATSEESSTNLRVLAASSETARQAAEAASNELFAGEPLPHIGSEAWQSLWESARAYSLNEAYPERAFPVIELGSFCVLCQQDLSSKAADRLNRFEAFVRDDSQQKADTARAAYTAAFLAFQQARLTSAELAEIVTIIKDDLRQDALEPEVRRAVLTAMWRHRQIIRRHTGVTGVIEPAAIALPSQTLANLVAHIDARGDELAAQEDSPARVALTTERTELADRQWLNGIKADVLAQIERLKKIEALETAQRETVTNRITAKSTEIAQALVTDALRAQFAREAASFEIAGLALELRQQNSVQGVPRFKVALTRQPSASVGQVLSEGEHRCVALAAFLAELATTENKSGIVFDDPISSLDHMHREAVAKRLIAEAVNRQVIVFTHDLAFLFELNRAASDIQPRPNVAISSVSRGSEKAGFCRSDPPFKARRVGDITSSLTRQVANERYHFDQGNQDEWRNTVKSVAGTLRDTWEIAVEEIVGHVIRRLSNKVNTSGLVKLTTITVADCETMRDGFERCSELLHSDPRDLNRPLPQPDDLVAEITALSTWADDLRRRQSALS